MQAEGIARVWRSAEQRIGHDCYDPEKIGGSAIINDITGPYADIQSELSAENMEQ